MKNWVAEGIASDVNGIIIQGLKKDWVKNPCLLTRVKAINKTPTTASYWIVLKHARSGWIFQSDIFEVIRLPQYFF